MYLFARLIFYLLLIMMVKEYFYGCIDQIRCSQILEYVVSQDMSMSNTMLSPLSRS